MRIAGILFAVSVMLMNCTAASSQNQKPEKMLLVSESEGTTSYEWNGIKFDLPNKAHVTTNTPESFAAMVHTENFGVQMHCSKTSRKPTQSSLKEKAWEAIDEVAGEDGKVEPGEWKGEKCIIGECSLGNERIRVYVIGRDKSLIIVRIFGAREI